MAENTNDCEELNQYLTFVLDDEEYGVPILTVRGIQGWEKTTPIPNSPDYIRGIINLRGEIVPIVDLRRRFNLEEVPYGPHTVVIVVRVGQGEKQRTVGLVVDAVADVHDINSEDIRSTPDFGEKINNEFVRGLGLIDEKLVIILEIDQLIDWRKVPVDNQVESVAQSSNESAVVEQAETEAA